jgi:hypothetical protein
VSPRAAEPAGPDDAARNGLLACYRYLLGLRRETAGDGAKTDDPIPKMATGGSPVLLPATPEKG